MKVARVLSVLLLSLLSNAVVSQNDTMYVVQDGTITGKHAVSSYDSIVFYDPISIKFNDSILTDASGNTYTSVKIGTQEWMAENLRATKYSDGTVIPNAPGKAEWYNLSTGAWCNYNNSSSNDATYGKLYNWYAVETGKLCPTGWHVPTDAEWTILTDYLTANGHNGTEGTALKFTSGWNSGGNGTNYYGWNGLSGGNRSSGGTFGSVGPTGHWWSSSQGSAGYAWLRNLYYYSESVFRGYDYKKSGFSVRCLNDDASSTIPGEDSLYLVKGDSVLFVYATTDIDSITFYRPNSTITSTTYSSKVRKWRNFL